MTRSQRAAATRPITSERGRARRGLSAISGVVAVAALMVGTTACADSSSTGAIGGTDESEATVGAAEAEDLLGPDDVATGEPIKIGQLSEGTSATVDAADELPAGAATVEFLNQHRGGIAGRPIELITCEMKADPAVAGNCADQMVREGVVAVTLPQAAFAESVWQTLHDAGIPLIVISGTGQSIENDAESSFIMVNPSAAFFALPIALAEAEDAKKVAFVVIDVPQALDVLNADDGATMAAAGLDYSVSAVPLGTPDMVPQMQEVVSGGAGVVHILGNDAFCIAAIQSLQAVGYTGAISGVSHCFTDATREALGDDLEGISVLAPLADGAVDDPTYQLYQAVMEEYGKGIKEVDGYYALSGYAAVATLGAVLEGADGDVTAATAAEAIRTMPETPMPAGGGVMIKCGGSAVPDKPAICTNQWLRGVLDASGNPGSYTVEDSSDILGG